MVVYEIEQKFCLNPSLLARFRSNCGIPPFHRLQFIRTESFDDTYYDSANKLSRNGIWLRKRNKVWEAKHRRSGDFLRTTFHETTNVDEIKTLVKAYTDKQGDVGPEDNFALDIICRYRTDRETFLVDDKFSVMLDATDFQHWVGEVELNMHNEQRAHGDIDAFIHKYS